MSLHQHLDKVPVVTFGSAASSIVIWGLHLSDVAAIVSACVAIAGLGIQIWVARTKVQLMKRRMGDGK
jgi:hypothetical protein